MDVATILGSGQGGGPGLLPRWPATTQHSRTRSSGDGRNLCVSVCERVRVKVILNVCKQWRTAPVFPQYSRINRGSLTIIMVSISGHEQTAAVTVLTVLFTVEDM